MNNQNIIQNNVNTANTPAWPELVDERLPVFPVQYLPDDCAE